MRTLPLLLLTLFGLVWGNEPAAIYGGFGEIVADLTADEQDALFRRNAIHLYDMGLPA